MASNKCSDLDEESTLVADLHRASDLESDINKKQMYDPDVLPVFKKIDQSIRNTIDRMKNYSGEYDPSKFTFNEKYLKKLIKRREATTDQVEKQTIITALQSQADADPGFLEALKESAYEITKTEQYKEQRKFKEAKVDPVTKLPNFYTLSVQTLRVLYHDLAPLMDVNENGDVLGRLGSNIAYEFALPKTIFKRAKDTEVFKYKKALYDYRNEMNRRVSSYSGPIDVPSSQERERVHPGTDIPVIDNIRRSKAGYADILDNINTTVNAYLKARGMVGDGSDQVHELITDLMHGKAFIRMDKKGFGKVYRYENWVPTERRYKESGDRIFRWKGNEFNEQQLEKYNKQYGNKFDFKEYVVPYQFGNRPQIDFGAEMKNGMSMANSVDSLLEHLDIIYREGFEDVKTDLTNVIEEMNTTLNEYKKKGIQMPSELFQELVTDKVNQEEFLDLLNKDISNIGEERLVAGQRIQAKEKIQSRKQHALEDGTIITARDYKRYYPKMYFSADVGEGINQALINIDSELLALQSAMVIDPDLIDENTLANLDKDSDRFNELVKGKAHLEQALARYLDLNGQTLKEDEVAELMTPFEKHFKPVTNFLPYDLVRKDKSVTPDYFNRISKTVVKAQLLSKLLSAYGRIQKPSFQNYLVNRYRIAWNSPKSEGSFLGTRFDMPTLAKKLHVSEDGVVNLLNKMRSLQTFQVLGGWTSGFGQLTSMANKMMELGYDATITGYQDSQLTENKALIIKSGILSFEDMIETHLLMEGNSAEVKRVEQLRKKYKEELETGKIQGYSRALLRTLEKNNSAWAQVPRSLANYAITGEFPIYGTDSKTVKNTKFVANFRKYVSMSLTERILRSTSFMMGVNWSIESGYAQSKDDPVATEFGKRFVQEMDFTLGNEGVGDSFGNSLMQWFNQVRVWSTQRMAYGKDAYKRAWLSEYAVNPDQSKITRSTKASMKFANALLLEASGNGLTVGSTLGGAAVMGSLLSGYSGVLGPVGAIAGGVAGYGASYLTKKITNPITHLAERRKALRLTNPSASKASQMLLFHGATSALYDFVLYNFDFSYAKEGALASGALKFTRRFAGNQSFTRLGSGFTSPLMRSTMMTMHLLYKALNEEEDVEPLDFVKLFGSFAGVGYMQFAYLLMDAFYDEQSLSKHKNKNARNGIRQFIRLNTPNIVPSELLGSFGADMFDIGEAGLKTIRNIDRYGMGLGRK